MNKKGNIITDSKKILKMVHTHTHKSKTKGKDIFLKKGLQKRSNKKRNFEKFFLETDVDLRS